MKDNWEYYLARKLLGDSLEEAPVAFISFLAKAVSQGHLCVQINENRIWPEPKDYFPEIENVHDLIRKGAYELPAHLLTNVDYHDLTSPATPICQKGDLFYFQRFWCDEVAVIREINRLIEAAPSITLEPKCGPELNSEQASAIMVAANKCLTIICGGPGTGKTYTAGQLIKLFWNSLDEGIKKNWQVALAAPTGKAASNLEASLNKATASIPEFPILKAKTLHALLGKGSARKAARFLSADLLLVDESSMIDVHMMSELLASIKPGARLILLGDPHQLPPIEAGSMFADLVDLLKPKNHVVELTSCVRIELESIVNFAGLVREGKANEAVSMIKESGCHRGIEFIKHEETQSISHSYRKLISHFKLQLVQQYNDQNELMKQFQGFRLLSPLREGPFGVDAINQMAFSHFCSKWRAPVFVAPIMILQNDYQLELFNGETGVLLCHNLNIEKGLFQKGDYALFKKGEQIRKYSAFLLPKFEFAYCLSVHKSQGSEFDEVLLLMPEGGEQFGREVIYTAATRAKKSLKLWGSENVILNTINRKSVRMSGLFSYSL